MNANRNAPAASTRTLPTTLRPGQLNFLLKEDRLCTFDHQNWLKIDQLAPKTRMDSDFPDFNSDASVLSPASHKIDFDNEPECIIENDTDDKDDELPQSVEVKQERINRIESSFLSPSKAPPADAVIVDVPDEVIDDNVLQEFYLVEFWLLNLLPHHCP